MSDQAVILKKWLIHKGIILAKGQLDHLHRYIVFELKSVHFKKPVTQSSFLSKSVVIFNITITNMTTQFERNEDHVTGFLK